MRRWSLCAALAVALTVSACAEPPNKEMDQAQGAIDAARAAGAERYAPTEYKAATQALKQANEAVTQRDYRLALNHALSSREHAQNAAREAADTMARTRGEVEREMAEVAALLAQANTRLMAAEAARVPARALRAPRETLSQINADVQKAGAAMQAGDYFAVQPMLKDLEARLEKVVAEIDAATKAQSSRRRR